MQKPLRAEAADDTPAPHDLAPRRAAPTEWWYVQGRIDIAGEGARSLMVMLLRRRGATEGWSLLTSLTDPRTGAREISSLACAGLVSNSAADLAQTLEEAGMPPDLARAYRDELHSFGPPAPVRISTEVPRVAANGLDIAWEGFRLSQAPDGRIALTVPRPGDGVALTLTLTPRAPWRQDETVGEGTAFGAMPYALCPRLSVGGSAGRADVTGRAWLDRQWGEDAWFRPGADKGQVLGWDWLGINLDDGRDLLVVTARDMLSGDEIRSSAALFPPQGAHRMLDRVEARPLAHWTSPDTHARYPVGWRIALTGIGADLTFTPDVKDCEVPFYGALGAVWEGGGVIGGRIGGTEVRGRGHLELFGYALPAAFERTKARWIERIDAHIAAVLPREITPDWLSATGGAPRYRYDTGAFGPMLSDPAWELMSRGGKHWRAIFGILMLRALGVEVAPYEALITTLPEMLHAGSLMIDDIQDHSALRRGGPAIHHLYGPEITINAANTLYFLPIQMVSRHPHLDLAQREAIHAIAIDLFVAAHFGQAQDLYSQNWRLEEVLADPGRFAEMVLQTCALKTGAPVKALAAMLCVIARADPARMAAATGFAEAAGVAYQVMDDVNSFSAGEAWGKETGEDVREGRLTYVILRALQALPPARRDRLAALLAQEGAAAQAEACSLVSESGVLETCRAEARAMVDTAWETLSAVLPASTSKTLLRMMFARLFARSEAPLQN